MNDPNGVLDAIADMEGAELPHIYCPTSVGDVVRQILAQHPLLPEASRDDARRMIAIVAGLDGAHHVHYGIGERDGGNLAGPGTWASVGKGGQAMLNISGTVPLVYPQASPPADPTLLERAAEELRRRVAAAGGDPAWVVLTGSGKADFGGEDRIEFSTPATPSGTDTFHVHLSHIRPPFSPGIERALDAAARAIIDQRRHPAEIRRRLERIQVLVRKRFGDLGMDVGDTLLLGVEADDTGVVSVKAATPVTILGDAFERRQAFLQMSEPPSRTQGEFDGFRVHSRHTRRLLELLGGRDPLDVYTMCPIAARDYAALRGEEARAKAADVRRAMQGRHDDAHDDKQGADFIEGRLSDTVYLAHGVTFRGRRLMARNIAPPESVLASLPGRPVTDIIDDPRLEGLIIEKVRVDSKGRLSVTTSQPSSVPLRAVLEAMEARAAEC